MAEGWIKLHRSITENWIWDNPQYLKWWLDLILMANHKEKKILFNGSFKNVGVGERITSEQKLAERWGVSRNTVRRFLNLLVEDKMISIEKSRQKGTTYKVNNYAVYQGFSEEKKHQTEQRNEHQKDNEVNNGLNINKNEKNEKNNKPSNQDSKDRFDFIWKKYPNKKGKAAAFKAYCKALKEGVTDETILDGINRYKKEIAIKNTDKQYIAHGSTWFSQNRWEDDYEIESAAKNEPSDADDILRTQKIFDELR
ncbi:GntR family transcriptional regulator [Enterococcus durans]|uniref:GntR family transcriptional regulator n=1 Tax=Enterococcus durans TaxID=53345 RepID=UPI001D0BB520|nr:GntR family transcriptional regulator [Enterococcus durans]